jgi:hypothetical protein
MSSEDLAPTNCRSVPWPERTREAVALHFRQAQPVDPAERIARGLHRATEGSDAWFEDSPDMHKYRTEGRLIIEVNAARRARGVNRGE